MTIPETTIKPVLSVRVEQRIIDRIDKLAAETGVNRANVIERALKIGLEDQEQFVGALKGNVTGPLLQLLLNEKFLNVIGVLGKIDPDPNQLNAIAKIRARARKAKGPAGKVVKA